MKNIELYVKGGLEDKIAFLCVLVAILQRICNHLFCVPPSALEERQHLKT